MPAPYRLSIFDNLSEFYDLEVLFMLSDNNWRGWKLRSEKKWTSKFLNLRYRLIGDYEFIPGLVNPYKWIGKPDYLILGSWESPLYLLFLVYGKLRGIPILGIYESHAASQRFKKGFVSFVRKTFFKTCHQVISFGGKSSVALEAMGLSSSKVISLYNPINNEIYESYSAKKWAESSSGHRFLFVGQLIQRKNVANLIRAFVNMSHDSDKLEIVGSGDQLDELIRMVEASKCKDRVIFIGQVDSEQIVSYYAKSDTLILPSTREVWGLVVNEALASGLHVVVSEDCGVTDFVRDMEGVYLCSKSIESIENAMIRSRTEFTGRIRHPEISNYSTSSFAQILSSFLDQDFH